MQNNSMRHIDLNTQHKELTPKRIKEDSNWRNWSRLTRQIYSLSTGTKTEAEIAQILNVNYETAHKFLCLFFLRGNMIFLSNGVPIIKRDLIITTYLEVMRNCDEFTFDLLSMISSRSPVIQQTLLTRNYTLQTQINETSVFLNLLFRCAKQDEENMIGTLKIVSEGYNLKVIPRGYFDIIQECFLINLKMKLSMMWSQEVEETWRELLEIVFSSLMFLATTPYLDF